MSNRPVPPTHLAHPLEQVTHGKRYYVIDDEKRVWTANAVYANAHRRKEEVAGAGWSKTPTIVEMPADKEQVVAIARAAVALRRQKAAEAAGQTAAPLPTLVGVTFTPAPAATPETVIGGVTEGESEDDDLESLLGGDLDGLDS